MTCLNIYRLKKWENILDMNKVGLRSGLRLHFDKNVNKDVRSFCIAFASWLRTEFEFPLRVNVYIKGEYRIRAKDGDFVVGTCWRPESYDVLPYIRLATGDYEELLIQKGKDQAMWAILHTFAHELTHYYQHINNIQLTQIGEERQASLYANRILLNYADFLNSSTGDGFEC